MNYPAINVLNSLFAAAKKFPQASVSIAIEDTDNGDIVVALVHLPACEADVLGDLVKAELPRAQYLGSTDDESGVTFTVIVPGDL